MFAVVLTSELKIVEVLFYEGILEARKYFWKSRKLENLRELFGSLRFYFGSLIKIIFTEIPSAYKEAFMARILIDITSTQS